MPCRSMSLVAAVKPLEMELDTDLPKLARSSIGRSFVAFCEKFFQSANGAAAGGEVRRAFRGGTGTARRGRGVRGTDHDPRAGRGARGGGTRADAPDMNVGPSEPDALIDGGRWTSAPRPRSWVAASAPRARELLRTRERRVPTCGRRIRKKETPACGGDSRAVWTSRSPSVIDICGYDTARRRLVSYAREGHPVCSEHPVCSKHPVCSPRLDRSRHSARAFARFASRIRATMAGSSGVGSRLRSAAAFAASSRSASAIFASSPVPAKRRTRGRRYAKSTVI